MASTSHDPLGAAETHDQLVQAVDYKVPWGPHGQLVQTGFQEHHYQMKPALEKPEKLVKSHEIDQVWAPDMDYCHWYTKYFGTLKSFPCFLASRLLAALRDETGWHDYRQ